MSEPSFVQYSDLSRVKGSQLRELKLSNFLEWWEDFLNKSGLYGHAGLEVVQGEKLDFVPRIRANVYTFFECDQKTKNVKTKHRKWDADAEKELVQENLNLKRIELTCKKERGVLWADVMNCLHSTMKARLLASDRFSFKQWQATHDCVELCLKLEKLCQGVSRDRLKELRQELEAIHHDMRKEDFDAFCVRLEVLFEQLEAAGDYMEERQKMEHLFFAVDQDFFESMLKACLENEISSKDYPEYTTLVPKMAEFYRKKMLKEKGMKRKRGGGDSGGAGKGGGSGETDDLGNPRTYTDRQMKRLKKKIRAEVLAMVSRDNSKGGKTGEHRGAGGLAAAVIKCFLCGLAGHRSNETSVCKAKNVKCAKCDSARHCTSMHEFVEKFKSRGKKGVKTSQQACMEVRELPGDPVTSEEADAWEDSAVCWPCPVDLIQEVLNAEFNLVEVREVVDSGGVAGGSDPEGDGDDSSSYDSDGSSDSSGSDSSDASRKSESATVKQALIEEEEADINPAESDGASEVVVPRKVTSGDADRTAEDENLVDSEPEEPVASGSKRKSGTSETKAPVGNSRVKGVSAETEETAAKKSKPAAPKTKKGKKIAKVSQRKPAVEKTNPLPPNFDEMDHKFRAAVYCLRKRELEFRESFFEDLEKILTMKDGVEAIRKNKGSVFAEDIEIKRNYLEERDQVLTADEIERAVFEDQQVDAEAALDKVLNLGILYGVDVEEATDRFMTDLLWFPVPGPTARRSGTPEPKASRAATPEPRSKPGNTKDSSSVVAAPKADAAPIKKRAKTAADDSDDGQFVEVKSRKDQKAEAKVANSLSRGTSSSSKVAEPKSGGSSRGGDVFRSPRGEAITAKASKAFAMLGGLEPATREMLGGIAPAPRTSSLDTLIKLVGRPAASRDGGEAQLEKMLQRKREAKAAELSAVLGLPVKPSEPDNSGDEASLGAAKPAETIGVKRIIDLVDHEMSDMSEVESVVNAGETDPPVSALTEKGKSAAKKKRRKEARKAKKAAETNAAEVTSDAAGQGVSEVVSLETVVPVTTEAVSSETVMVVPETAEAAMADSAATADSDTHMELDPGTPDGEALEPGEIFDGEAVKPVVGEPASPEVAVPAADVALVEPAVAVAPVAPAVEPPVSNAVIPAQAADDNAHVAVADICPVKVDVGAVIAAGYLPRMVNLNGPNGGQILALYRADGKPTRARDLISLLTGLANADGASKTTVVSMMSAEELERDMAAGELFGFVVPAFLNSVVRMAVINGKRVYLIDSGASTAVFRKWELGELSPLRANYEMVAANGTLMTIDKVGMKKGIGKLIVCKESKHDVLSVSQLCDATEGLTVLFTKLGVLINHPAIPGGIWGGRTGTGLYTIDLSAVKALIDAAAPEKSVLCPIEVKPGEASSGVTDGANNSGKADSVAPGVSGELTPKEVRI